MPATGAEIDAQEEVENTVEHVGFFHSIQNK